MGTAHNTLAQCSWPWYCSFGFV